MGLCRLYQIATNGQHTVGPDPPTRLGARSALLVTVTRAVRLHNRPRRRCASQILAPSLRSVIRVPKPARTM